LSNPLILQLSRRDEVPAYETRELLDLFTNERVAPVGQELIPEGSRSSFSLLLLDGFAARFKTLSTGARQITGVHVPGDFLDLHGFLLKTLAYGVVTLSDCRIVQADHEALRKITATSPHLARLLWLDTLIDASISREWLASMGRRSAEGHLAHLICELFTRLDVVQQTSGYSFRVPFKQADLADILGLSVVHVNRTLQSLRKQGLIIWEGMRVHVESWDGLVKIAEFDPTYLCLNREPR